MNNNNINNNNQSTNALSICSKLTGGEVVGESVVYYDDTARLWYVADIDAAEAAIEYADVQDGYSLWCGATMPSKEYLSREDAIASLPAEEI